MKKNKNLLITFSGGRTSAFMSLFSKEYYKDYNKLFVFANTGKEKEETLTFVDECDKHFKLNLVWLEADINPIKGKGTGYKIVNHSTATRGKKLFENLCKKYGLPSKLFRHCTRELKEAPIHKFAKDYFGSKNYLTAIGIRYDEKNRIKNDPKKIYPLAQDLKVDEKFIRDFWKKQPFDLQIKDYQGNCDLCFLKSKRKKLTIISENAGIAEDWKYLENKYGKHNQPIFDVRGKISIEQLIEEAKRPFIKAIDKEELRNLKIPFSDDMDVEYSCYCKSV